MSWSYFVVWKPYGVLSQFTPEAEGQTTLADVFDLPPGVYPVGRLDRDSEGLLILSDDPALNKRLLDPAHRHPRRYWVQTEGIPTDEALRHLSGGLPIRVEGKTYHTRPAKAMLIEPAPALPPRIPPIRFRKELPTGWLSLELSEGKNRQVRRMCAAVGFPVLRLVRVAIGGLDAFQEGIEAGAQRAYSGPQLRKLLGI